MFARILIVALIAGSVSGIAVSLLQFGWSLPLILEAERYETVANGDGMGGHVHSGDFIAADIDDGDAWESDFSFGRGIRTLVTNTILAVGSGLLIAAVFALRRQETSLTIGLAWGGAAFLVFAGAPALGLPPELPGTEVADLAARQAWWLATAGATAAGLALIVYGGVAGLRIAGVAVLALPHVVGAPRPEAYSALAPEALRHEFVVAALLTSGIFWVMLGGIVGLLSRRFRLVRGA